MSYIVYLRTNKVNGMKYVGQTCDFKEREYDWKTISTRYANKYIDVDREKYGLSNFETTILAEVNTREEAWELEKKYIKELGTKYPDGYNMGYGGKTSNGVIRTEETIRKLKESHIGNKQTEETKRKIIKTLTNRKDLSKPIAQYTKNGKFITTYKSIAEAARVLGLCSSNIIKCLQEKISQTGGYIFKYI